MAISVTAGLFVEFLGAAFIDKCTLFTELHSTLLVHIVLQIKCCLHYQMILRFMGLVVLMCCSLPDLVKRGVLIALCCSCSS